MRIIKSRNMGWAERIARIGRIILAGKPEEKRLLELDVDGKKILK
jgi:hypothetical protein